MDNRSNETITAIDTATTLLPESNSTSSNSTPGSSRRLQSLNRDRPTDFMGGCQLSFRERPPPPLKIKSMTSVKDSPFHNRK